MLSLRPWSSGPVRRTIRDVISEPRSERALLTARELEVLEMAARGLTNDAMARHLSLSVHGVKFHLSSIYRKLGVSNRTEAVARLLTSGPRFEEQ